MLGFQTSHYDLGIIPKMVYLFGTIFNDLQIPRMDTDGNTLRQLIRVPIIYSAKDKLLARLAGDPGLDRKPAIVLPMLSYEHVDMQYDNNRKLGSMNKYVVIDDDHNKMKRQYTSVPYNFIFHLHVYAAHALDLNNIIEQILPFFTPEFTVRANLIPRMAKTWDIPVAYTGIIKNDEYPGKVEDSRHLTSTLMFTVKGHLFGPIVTQPVIKFANTNFYIPEPGHTIEEAIGETDPIDRVTVQPGLTANGEPTTNAELSVPIANIEANSDWAYITTVYGGPLGANTPYGGE